MKKHLLLVSFFLLMFVGTAFAQTQTNAIATTGLVGIDITTSLTAPLTVNSPNTSYIVIGNPTVTGYTSLGFGLTSQTSGSAVLQAVKTNGTTPVYGNIWLNPYGGYTSVGALTTPTPMLLGALDVSGAFAIGGSTGNICPSCYSLSSLTSTGKMLVGWNRSNGLGETDFIANEGAGSQGGFWFETYNSSTEKPLMYILGNGNVGIGMATSTFPTEYKLAVDGSIIGTAVVVQAYANWSDYVFAPDYRLPKLSYVKKYVLLNHHLPDVPSAAIIKNKGLNLGDVENDLTKKVEELTLYLIQKDEQISKEKIIVNQQQKEIDGLKAEMNAIEKKLAGRK